jgi:hypothetical protein
MARLSRVEGLFTRSLSCRAGFCRDAAYNRPMFKQPARRLCSPNSPTARRSQEAGPPSWRSRMAAKHKRRMRELRQREQMLKTRP